MIKPTESSDSLAQWESAALKNRIFLAMLSVAFFPLALYSLFVLSRFLPAEPNIDWVEPLFVFALCLIAISLFSLYISQRLAEPMRILRETQTQLIQTAKLASVGTLAAGVAHELNQSLMVIRGYTQMLLEETQENANIKDELTRIESQTTRMMKIIRQLKDFSRPSKGEYEMVYVQDVIENALTMLERPLHQAQIKVIKNFGAQIQAIHADKSQLEQVFVNLLLNAMDAMTEQPSPQMQIVIQTDIAHPHQVQIEFHDNGRGMSTDLQAHIFDPFFTSKDVGQGTGLGLSISYGLIKAHGGWIEVESTADQGSLFRIILPTKGPSHV